MGRGQYLDTRVHRSADETASHAHNRSPAAHSCRAGCHPGSTPAQADHPLPERHGTRYAFGRTLSANRALRCAPIARAAVAISVAQHMPGQASLSGSMALPR